MCVVCIMLMGGYPDAILSQAASIVFNDMIVDAMLEELQFFKYGIQSCNRCFSTYTLDSQSKPQIFLFRTVHFAKCAKGGCVLKLCGAVQDSLVTCKCLVFVCVRVYAR